MIAAILAFINKLLDFLTPITSFFIKKRETKQRKRDIAQSNLDKAKDENPDDFLDSLADKHGA